MDALCQHISAGRGESYCLPLAGAADGSAPAAQPAVPQVLPAPQGAPPAPADADLRQLAARGFSCCILAAPAVQPRALLAKALPLLQPSAAFAVFSPWSQPLAEAMMDLQVGLPGASAAWLVEGRGGAQAREDGDRGGGVAGTGMCLSVEQTPNLAFSALCGSCWPAQTLCCCGAPEGHAASMPSDTRLRVDHDFQEHQGC